MLLSFLEIGNYFIKHLLGKNENPPCVSDKEIKALLNKNLRAARTSEIIVNEQANCS